MNQNINQTNATLPSIEAMLTSHNKPVTVFSLSWCSYCHAVKQLLQQSNVPFEEYVLDQGTFANEASHQQLRQQLQHLTNSRTLPQVFIARQSVGGYTETLAAIRSGQFNDWLKEAGANHA